MLVYAAILFALAATFGATMAARHFRGKDLPIALPLSHGRLAIAGFAVLGYVLPTRSVSPITWVVFGFFVMAAIGGLILFRSYWCRRPLSSGMIVIHAMVAGMGLNRMAEWLKGEERTLTSRCRLYAYTHHE